MRWPRQTPNHTRRRWPAHQRQAIVSTRRSLDGVCIGFDQVGITVKVPGGQVVTAGVKGLDPVCRGDTRHQAKPHRTSDTDTMCLDIIHPSREVVGFRILAPAAELTEFEGKALQPRHASEQVLLLHHSVPPADFLLSIIIRFSAFKVNPGNLFFAAPNPANP